MSNEAIKRGGDFKFSSYLFSGPRAQQMMLDGKVARGAPDACAWLDTFGLVVRYSEKRAVGVTVDTVAAAAIEMARDIPAMRQALLVALTAMDADTTTSEPTLGG